MRGKKAGAATLTVVYEFHNVKVNDDDNQAHCDSCTEYSVCVFIFLPLVNKKRATKNE